MKRHLIFIAAISFILAQRTANGQDINWKNTAPETRHFVSLNVGLDYTSNYSIAYGYQISNKWLPLVVGQEISLPFGKTIFDDWKSITSIQGELWRSDNFSLALKTGLVMRRFESQIAKLNDIGFQVSPIFEYGKSRWGVGVVINYERSLFVHLDHELLKEYYPEIRDGWYHGSGGTVKTGIRMRYSLESWNFFLNGGRTFGQNLKDDPSLTIYGVLGIQRKF